MFWPSVPELGILVIDNCWLTPVQAMDCLYASCNIIITSCVMA